MIHRAVTIKRVKAEECRESWFSKSRDPEKGFGSPSTPGAIPLIRHTQAKPSWIIHPPTSAPVLTLSHKNKSSSSLPFVQSSPQSWHTVPSIGAAASPTRLEAPAGKRRKESLHFHFCPGPHTGAWLTGGREAPTAANLK